MFKIIVGNHKTWLVSGIVIIYKLYYLLVTLDVTYNKLTAFQKNFFSRLKLSLFTIKYPKATKNLLMFTIVALQLPYPY